MAKTYLCGTPREVVEAQGLATKVVAEGFSQAAEMFAAHEALVYGPHPVQPYRERVFMVSDGTETFAFRTRARHEVSVSVRWERDFKP